MFKYTGESLKSSVVLVRLLKSDVVGGVDLKVRSVDVVAFHYHLENFWLVYCALLHEVYDLVLHRYRVVYIIVQLNLELVSKLAVLLQNFLIFDWVGEIFVIFSKQTHLAVVSP